MVVTYRTEAARIAGRGKRVRPVVGHYGEMRSVFALHRRNVQIVKVCVDLHVCVCLYASPIEVTNSHGF